MESDMLESNDILPSSGAAIAGVSAGSPIRARSGLLVVVLVSLVATLVTWGCGELLADWFRPVVVGNAALGPMQGGATIETSDRARVWNASLVYAIQGATLGLALGMLGAFIRRSTRPLPAAALIGCGLGGLVAAIAALSLFPISLREIDPLSNNLIPPLLTHAAVWVPMGTVAGIAFGIGRGHSIARAAFGGFLGAAFATTLYEIVGALCFPLSQTAQPLASTTDARLLAYGLVNLLVSLGVAHSSEPQTK